MTCARSSGHCLDCRTQGAPRGCASDACPPSRPADRRTGPDPRRHRASRGRESHDARGSCSAATASARGPGSPSIRPRRRRELRDVHARICASRVSERARFAVILAMALAEPGPPTRRRSRADESRGGRFLRTHGTRMRSVRHATCATCTWGEARVAYRSAAARGRRLASRPARDAAPGALTTRSKQSSHTPDIQGATRADANARPMTCASCHARESCTSCHVGARSRAVAAMSPAASGTAGAQWTRAAPSSHTWEFREGHGAEANARPATCETCHVRSTCLECHRPDGGRQSGYHAQGFLTRHPSSAYAREANCSDCHNPAQFCQSCHQKAGLVRPRVGQKVTRAFRGSAGPGRPRGRARIGASCTRSATAGL